MNKIVNTALATSVAAFMFTACGGGSGSGTEAITGVFLDDPVQGLSYSCSSSNESGTTDFAGRYTCKSGDTVTFSMGNISLGTVTVTTTPITPYTVSADDTSAINLAQLLQSLNNNLTTTTAQSVLTALESDNVTLDSLTFDEDVNAILIANDITSGLVSETTAKNTLDSNIQYAIPTIEDSMFFGKHIEFTGYAGKFDFTSTPEAVGYKGTYYKADNTAVPMMWSINQAHELRIALLNENVFWEDIVIFNFPYGLYSGAVVEFTNVVDNSETEIILSVF